MSSKIKSESIKKLSASISGSEIDILRSLTIYLVANHPSCRFLVTDNLVNSRVAKQREVQMRWMQNGHLL